MTMDRDLDRVLALWLEDGPTEIAGRVVTGALDTIDHTAQALPWRRGARRFTMDHPLRIAGAALAAVIAIAVVANLLNQSTLPPVAETPSPPPPATGSPEPAPPSILPSIPPSAQPTSTPEPPAAGPPLIAYTQRDRDPVSGLLTYRWNVWTVQPDGSNRRRLNASLSVEPTSIAWSPDGSRVLAYAQGYPNVEPETSPGVYAIEVSSGSATQLTHCETPCFRDDDPELSTDGSTLLVVRRSGDVNFEASESVIVSIDLATGRATEIASTRLDGSTRPCGKPGVGCTGPWNRGPTFSPDGSRIAYARMEEVATTGSGIVLTRGDIVVMNADGSDRRTLDLGGLSASDPVWSPDGSRILFSSHVEDYPGVVRVRRDIYRIHADGTGLHRLTRGGNSAGATWTSDGRIRFVRLIGDDGEINFWVMRADGSHAEQVTQFVPGAGGWSGTDLADSPAAWQPDPGP